MGQFSNKLVKVLAFQKLMDYEEPEPVVDLPPQPSPTKVSVKSEPAEDSEAASPGIKKKKTGKA